MDTAIKRLLDLQAITSEEAYLKCRNKEEFQEYGNYEEIAEDSRDNNNDRKVDFGDTINI